GLRFAAAIDTKLRYFRGGMEYGFLAALENSSFTDDALKFPENMEDNTNNGNNGTGTTTDGVRFVWGKVFYVDEHSTKQIDRNNSGKEIHDKTGVADDQDLYTILLTGIPDNHFDTVFVVRPYVKVGGVYYYGTTQSCSYNQAYAAVNGTTAQSEEENV
ncbi:MAG: hypothetical protein ACI4RV_08070, partial [Eubacteriales bacterium]